MRVFVSLTYFLRPLLALEATPRVLKSKWTSLLSRAGELLQDKSQMLTDWMMQCL